MVLCAPSVSSVVPYLSAKLTTETQRVHREELIAHRGLLAMLELRCDRAPHALPASRDENLSGDASRSRDSARPARCPRVASRHWPGSRRLRPAVAAARPGSSGTCNARANARGRPDMPPHSAADSAG